MNKKTFIITTFILILILSACTVGGGTETAVSTTTSNGKTRLSADYKDALSVQSQLALGTLQLEDTELAVDEALAAEILPLWQAVQSLSNSETAATAEVEAVTNQIQDTMDPAQVQTIADMALTSETMTTLLESGELNMGPRGFGNRQEGDDANSEGGFPGGGRPIGSIPGGAPGNGPGGGIPGSSPGAGRENLSEDDIATRQAEMESGDGLAQFQDRALIGAVIRTLQTKTGEVPEGGPGVPGEGGPGDLFNTALEVVSAEIGVSVEEMQAQMNEGQTVVQIIEAADGDVEAIRTALIEALSNQGEDTGFPPEEFVNNLLQQ